MPRLSLAFEHHSSCSFAVRIVRALIPGLFVVQYMAAAPVAAQEEIIHRDHGGGVGLRDIGAGIAIGVGTELLLRQLAKPPEAQKVSKPPVRKTPGKKPSVAKKPDPKKDKPLGAKVPAPAIAETPPTPVAMDPKVGIAVDGGIVHRATDTYRAGKGDDRGGVYCWVDPTARAACTDFQWFQFVCVELKIDLGDGKGFQPPPAGAAKDITIESATGAYMKIGAWSADDHSSTRNKKRQKMAGDPIPSCPEPKTALTGGAYATPEHVNIAGLPKLKPTQTKERLQRLVDAPTGLPAVKQIVDKLGLDQRRKLEGDEKMPVQDEAPAEGSPVTMQFIFHFRTALYCAGKCLGQFDWTSTESIKVTPTWSQVARKVPNQPTRWQPSLKGERIGVSTVAVGAWKECAD